MPTLGDLCSTLTQTRIPAALNTEYVWHFSIPAFDESGTPARVPPAAIGSSKLLITKPCILFSRLNPRIPRVWDVSTLPSDHPSLASTEFVPFVIEDESRLHGRYLYWFLQSKSFVAGARAGVRAATKSRERVEKASLFAIHVPLPALGEQRRIAAVLDKAEAVRRMRRESLPLLDECLCSAFLQMFGDPVRNEMGWRRGNAASAIREIAAGTSVKEEEGGAPKPTDWSVLRISAVTSGHYLPNERKVVASPPQHPIIPRRGDLLFSRANTRELVAATCLVDQDVERVFLPDKLWRITPHRDVATVEYLRFLFANSLFREVLTRQATGTSGSMLNVSQEKVLRVMLPLPPLPLQQRFGALVWRAYKLRDAVQHATEQLLGLFESLEQSAFGGDGSAAVAAVVSR